MDTSSTTLELVAVPGVAGAATAPTLTCNFCLTLLTPGRRKWCSKKCHRLFTRKYDARVVLCEVCQKAVTEKRRFKYCSEACKKQAKVDNNRKERQEKTKAARGEKHCRQCDSVLSSWKKWYCNAKCFKQSKADKLRDYRAAQKAADKPLEALPGLNVVGDCEWCQVLEAETKEKFETPTCCNSCAKNSRSNGNCPKADCGRPIKKYRPIVDGKSVWRGFCSSCDSVPEGLQAVVLLNDYDNREKTVWIQIQKAKSGRPWAWVYKSHFEPRAGVIVVTVPLAWWLKIR